MTASTTRRTTASRSRIAAVGAIAVAGTLLLTSCGDQTKDNDSGSSTSSSAASNAPLADKLPKSIRDAGTVKVGSDIAYAPVEFKDSSGKTYRKCMLDSDCSEKIPGQCDHGPPGTTGTGYCLSTIGGTNLYELATSNYIAAGGSGFRVLQRNTTQFDTKIQQRDALIDYLRQGHPCGYDPNAGTAEGLKACSQNTDCSADGSFVCACPGHTTQSGAGDALTCTTTGQCGTDVGRCVRADCRDQVAQFHSRACATSPNAAQCQTDLNACTLGGEECKFLSCVDETLGNYQDNRVQLIGK